MLDHGFTYVSVGRPATYQAQQGKLHQLGVWKRLSSLHAAEYDRFSSF
jgi:hypothetical protein